MCRYAMHPSRISFVCIEHRHVAQVHEYRQPRCPFCRTDMVKAGRDFKAPRKRDNAGWRAVQIVLDSGRNYDSCGCCGPGYRPRTAAAARQDAMVRPMKRPKGFLR